MSSCTCEHQDPVNECNTACQATGEREREQGGGREGVDLHSGLYNINGGVSKHTGSTSRYTTECSPQGANILGVVISLEPVLHVLVDKKTDGLIGTLL